MTRWQWSDAKLEQANHPPCQSHNPPPPPPPLFFICSMFLSNCLIPLSEYPQYTELLFTLEKVWKRKLPHKFVFVDKGCSSRFCRSENECSLFFFFFSLLFQALSFLGSFAAFLPTADSLSCYSCLDYPGSSKPCSNPLVEQCGALYDSCVSSVILAEYFGSRYTTTVKNCSISQYNCNSSFICDLVNSSIASANGIMLSCSVNCCYSDLCNGQGGPG